MTLVTEHVATRLSRLAKSILLDPGSFGNWTCLWYPEANAVDTSSVEQALSGFEHAIFICEDEIIVFARDVSEHQITTLQPQFKRMPVHIMNVAEDWRTLSSLLMQVIAQNGEKVMNGVATASIGAQTPSHDIRLQTAPDTKRFNLRKHRAPLHVMLVEDDLLTQRLMKQHIEHQYPIAIHSNPNEAVGNYFDYVPDIVFLDIELEGFESNGFDVLKQIVANDPNAYVVMFSSLGDADTVTRAMQRGARGFITKPFSPEKVQHYLEACQAHKSQENRIVH